MHKTLVLGVLLVFALSVQAPSGNHPVVSMSETETISAIGTPQVTSVSPKTSTAKTPTAPKAPQLNPLIVAANNMQDAAGQMALQYQRYQREYTNLSQNLTVEQKQLLRQLLQGMQSDEPGTKIEHLRQDIYKLEGALHSVFTPSKTN